MGLRQLRLLAIAVTFGHNPMARKHLGQEQFIYPLTSDSYQSSDLSRSSDSPDSADSPDSSDSSQSSD